MIILKKKVKKKYVMSKFERLLYTFTVFLLVIAPISIVFSKATLAKINFEVEKQKEKLVSKKKLMNLFQWLLMS